jgi:1-acyl-sn-glycerol-3-phosphate acyltransferase
MKSVFGKIWAVYAVFLFLLMMTLSVPVLLFNMAVTPGDRALKKNINYLYHFFTPVFLSLVGVRLRIAGQEHLDLNASYVIIGNHKSAIDFIINAVAFPGIFRFLAKQELQKIPVFGWVVKKMCLIVDRSSAMSRARSVVNLKKHLEDGWSIFIYPEGGRNRTTEPLAPFYDGAFRLAIQMGAPIAIQTVRDIEHVTTSVRSVELYPGVVNIAWSQPIETKNLSTQDIPELKERVRQIMLENLRNE